MPPSTSSDNQHLIGLAELCKSAGAAASTVFYSRDQVVVFYNQPQIIGASQLNGFDELHIRHPKCARILIAVFPESE